MMKSDIDYISTEKKKVKKYFILRTLFIFSFVVSYCFFAYQYVSASGYPLGSEKIQGIFFFFLPAVLVLITFGIWAIPGTACIKEYPEFKRTMMMIWLFWLGLNIILPFLPLKVIIPLSSRVKLCIVFSVFSLYILILYFLIVHSSIYDTLRRLFVLSARPFAWNRNIDYHTSEKTNKKISSIGRLIIHSLHEYEEKTFNTGLSRIDTLGKIVLSSELNPELLNGIFKNIIVNYRNIASECIKAGLENYSRLTFFNITNLIKYGIACKNKAASKINYPIAVIAMKEAGLMSVVNDMHPVSREIIEYLGQIGEISFNYNLDHPPDIEVLTALQEIGTECANRKLENLCLEILIRTEFLGIEALNTFESASDLKRKKEKEKVYKSSLTSHWIVSAFLFKNIPESEEWLKDSRNRMGEVFGDAYGEAYNKALKKMDLASYVGKKILLDYNEAIQKKFRSTNTLI